VVDTTLVIFGSIFVLTGLVGSLLPVLPGPPLSYAGLLLLQFTSKHPFSVTFLIVYAILTILVTILDYGIPIYGTKKFEGSKYGIGGSTLGLIAGLIFLPFGIIIGPLMGAFLGELYARKSVRKAFKPAMGSLLGSLVGTAIKTVLCLVIAYHFVVNAFL
jgi:uncharacterized protein YqgC (DUF456 family)